MKVERTTAGLREALFDQIEKVRAGEADINQAKAVASLAGQIVNTIKVELAYWQMTDGVAKMGSLALGRPALEHEGENNEGPGVRGEKPVSAVQ